MNRILAVCFIALSAIRVSAVDFNLPSPAVAGIYIEDIVTGEVLADINGSRSMIPASITKALTSASVLADRKPDFRFATEVFLSGPVKGGSVDGNLVIKVCGDPTLESSYFPDNTGFTDSIVSILTNMGISEIKGDIIINKKGFIDQSVPLGWVEEDLAHPYGAGHYATNYKDNKFTLTLPEKSTIPKIPNLKIKHTPSKGALKVERKRGSDIFLTKGGARRKQQELALANPSPQSTLLCELREAILNAGLSLGSQKIEDGCTPVISLYTHYSPELRDILRSLMFRSDNMMAEGALRLLAEGQSREKAVEHEMSIWELRGIDTESVNIEDGSGLSRRDRMTPYFMADMLGWMALHHNAMDYVNLFPKAGLEGTLKSLLADSSLAGELVLKSGSMKGVHCYAGYKIDQEGFPTHVVVIMINNFTCGRATVKKEIENLLRSIFAPHELL
ncbi:MAG: D-alanyl-D-alanine carboxypeptidase/D-alanyl-D-alanine-endopeptidase [Paramuribaculum sp.]|nr:D-alanyl-D-alanine carboxypeptidase/D-alanyl-D-alanine-endopeptidase [Paramuribaculum sp.]